MNIGELGRVVTGTTPPSARPEQFGTEYPFITPSDLGYDTRSPSVDRHLSREGALAHSRRTLPPGTVAFTCIGATIGKCCLVSETSFTNQQINSIIVDRDRFSPDFVYYLMRFETELIKAQASGAATPIISKSAFEQIQITSPIPDLDTQQEIGGILSAYDQLIENNTSRIKILEEMAQSIYKEWFVNFRYPGHENVPLIDSPLGPIPDGWEWSTVGDVCERIQSGGTPSRKVPDYWDRGEIDWFTTSELNDGFLGRSKERITRQGSLGSSARLFDGGTILMAIYGATIGKMGVLTAEASCNQAALGMTANTRLISQAYLYWSLLNLREDLIAVAQGAAQQNVSKEKVANAKVRRPSRSLIDRFDDVVLPVWGLTRTLTEANTHLRAARDLLLPRLVSGEIEVSRVGKTSDERGPEPVLKLAIDSCVVIAAANVKDEHHAPCRTLFDQAAAGRVELLVGTAFDYDQERGWDRNPERAARTEEWLAGERVTRANGPLTLDVSLLGSDSLISDEYKAVFDRIEAEFGAPPTAGDFDRRKHFDVHHYEAAILADATAFVTTDDDDILGRLRKAVDGAPPLPVITPEEAIEMVRSESH